MTSTFRIAHQAFLLINGEVAASGTPDELAYGDNKISREFIAASGIAPDRISRVGDREAEESSVIRYRAAE
jgi:phospholipid/cholesterol/gamma-HCH transport system ATP-binding protein